MCAVSHYTLTTPERRALRMRATLRMRETLRMRATLRAELRVCRIPLRADHF